MRRLAILLVSILLILALAGNVFAATGASAAGATIFVASDGSCQINLALTLHMETPVSKLYFPIPTGASGVRVNGSRVITSKSGDSLQVNLSRYVRNITGDVSVNLQYDLYGLVKETEIGTLELQLPLLSGFSYAVENLQFTVTLPGEIKSLPAFTSGYHQSSIEQDLSYTVEGATITGNSLKAMKDHETLTMRLPVDDSLFTRVVVGTQSTLTARIGMISCAVLALLYWLLTLRAFPLRRYCCEVPDGFSAGQIGCLVGSGGVDLTTMVLSWAQLGYVLIQPDRRGKVLLHKRMDMGNERSELERRCFHKVFGSRNMVDATSARYAQLRLQLAEKPAGVQELLQTGWGRPVIFRGILCGVGLFAGGGIGALMGSGAALQWVLIVLMAALGAVSSWYILPWTDSGLTRDKLQLGLGLGLSLIWILLSLSAGDISLGVTMAVVLLIGGILYGWSGRRTELGKHIRAQALGLRHYLLGGDREQLRRACQQDPDYFFRMAPYAIALGVGKSFAKAVGREKLERCPYLTTGMDGHMSAIGWNHMLEKTVSAMDARSKRLGFEKLIKLIDRITRP